MGRQVNLSVARQIRWNQSGLRKPSRHSEEWWETSTFFGFLNLLQNKVPVFFFEVGAGFKEEVYEFFFGEIGFGFEGIGGEDTAFGDQSLKAASIVSGPGVENFVKIIGANAVLETVNGVVFIEPEDEIHDAIADHLAFAVVLVLRLLFLFL